MAGLCNHALELTGTVGDCAGRIHRLDPRAKIAGLFGVTLVAVSAAPRQWPIYLACAAVLVAVTLTARVPPAALWRRGRVVLAPVLLVAIVLPLVRTGGAAHRLGPLTLHDDGLTALGAVAAKATIGTAAAALFTCTTTFPSALRGFEALRVPRTLVLIAAFMYRYLFVIVEEVARVHAALVSRGYQPRHALQAGAVGRAATTLFLRSHARGERVHRAMLARGYAPTRGMPYGEPLAFGRAERLFVALVALALLPLRALVEGGL